MTFTETDDETPITRRPYTTRRLAGPGVEMTARHYQRSRTLPSDSPAGAPFAEMTVHFAPHSDADLRSTFTVLRPPGTDADRITPLFIVYTDTEATEDRPLCRLTVDEPTARAIAAALADYDGTPDR